MKIYTAGLLTLTLCSMCVCALSAEPPFLVAIGAGQTTFTAGSPIELEVTLTNTSAGGISLFVDKSKKAELSGFGVEVIDSRGLTPKITRYHDALTGEKAPRESVANPSDLPLFISSGGEMVLAPGKAEHFRMNIAALFDLKVPGQYSIRLKRTDPATGTPVMSNILKITISR